MRGGLKPRFLKVRAGCPQPGSISKAAATVVMTLIAATAVAFQVGTAVAAGPNPVPIVPFQGFSPLLTRAPYLSDLTQSSVEVTWATTTSGLGYVEWGPMGDCAANSAPVPSSLPPSAPSSDSSGAITTRTFTVLGATEYQSAVGLTGLSPSTNYCYRPFGLDTSGSPVDLLGSNASPSFTTLDPASTSSTTPLSFAVFADTGENLANNANQPFPIPSAQSPNYINPEQAAIDHLIGQSGARFVLMAGDVAYPDGLNDRYGDLQQGGSSSNPEASSMFGPSYWPQTGGVPAFYADGNHGLASVDPLRNWPETATATASDGVYAPIAYPSIQGSTAATYPSNWYAFSSGNVRVYVLQVAWADMNAGSAPGGPYQVDALAHWQSNSAEYQWLQQDLAAHPGGIKFAVWHYPLRSYNSNQAGDTYLEDSSSNPNGAQGSLEALLAQNGVDIAFNGHAHTYQRIDPSGPGQVISYVTGGGGGVPAAVSCGGSVTGVSSLYAIGWDPSTLPGVGSSCGAPNNNVPVPQSAAQVYNFLSVTVNGTQVTVSPTNAAGQVFDQQTYNFGTTGPPPAPTVTSIGPTSGVSTGGTVVTIDGTNLTGAGAVDFGSNAASSYTVSSGSQISATSPPGTGTVDITVTTPGGSSTTSSADRFTYTTPTSAPSVSGLGLSTGPTSGGTAVTVFGSNFSANATVQFGTTPAATVSAVSQAQLTAVSPAGSVGTVDVTVTTSAGTSAHTTADQFAYVPGSGYTALPPTRLLDTRTTGQTLAANSALNLMVMGGAVPPNATAVALNVTVTDTSAASYLSVYPAGASRPLVSNLNWAATETVPNLVIVPVGTNGQVTFYNDLGRADVVVDLEGYFAPEPSGSTAGSYVALAPARITDTRPGSGEPNSGSTLGPGGTLSIQVTGKGGVPATGVAAVVLNVTVTDTTAASYLTAYPQGPNRPFASNLNWSAGATVGNRVVVSLGPTGQVTVYSQLGRTDVVVDVSGYFTDASSPPSSASLFYAISPIRVLDSRLTGLPLGAGSTITQQMAGLGGIDTNATAVVSNVTATDTSAGSYFTVYPGGVRPLASDVNWGSGQTVPNLTVATLSNGGSIEIYNAAGQADVVVDAFGYFCPG